MTTPTLPEWGAVGPGTVAARTLLKVFGTPVEIVGADFTETGRSVIIRPVVERDVDNRREVVVMRGYIPAFSDLPELGKSELFAPNRATTNAKRYFCTSANRQPNGWLQLELNEARANAA